MLKNYIKISFKVLLRRKFFTFISLFGVSFTLMVLMVGSAFLDHMFGPMAPEKKIDRTLTIMRSRLIGPTGSRTGFAGYRLLDQYARKITNLENFSILSSPVTAYSYLNNEKIRSYLKRTDGQFWQILEFNFLEGGPFSVEDEKNGNLVAVINKATREKFFGNDSAVGKYIEVDGQRFRVCGVVENVPISRIIPFSDIWVPISTAKSDSFRKDLVGSFVALVLVRDQQDIPRVKSEFNSLLSQIEFDDPNNFNRLESSAETFFEAIAGTLLPGDQSSDSPKILALVLLVLTLLFMLLPALNLVNINVSRIMERASEIGVRKAFGASSRTLVGQFIVENLVLTLIGGAIGLLLSFIALSFINESGFIAYAQLKLNYRIFIYGLFLAIFFGFFSGVYPAWKMSRMNPVQALKGGVR